MVVMRVVVVLLLLGAAVAAPNTTKQLGSIAFMKGGAFSGPRPRGGYEAEISMGLNKIRRSLQLPALQYSAALQQIAQQQSRAEAGANTTSSTGANITSVHVDKTSKGQTYNCSRTTLTYSASSSSSLSEVLSSWLKHDEARGQMLSPQVTHLGAAQARRNGSTTQHTLVLGACKKLLPGESRGVASGVAVSQRVDTAMLLVLLLIAWVVSAASL